MALPPENRTPRMEMLEAIVRHTPRERLMDFPVLQPGDHQLIGAFIQEFNYIDFNLRRGSEIFAHAKLLSEQAVKKYPKIHSSEVASVVQEGVAVEDIADTLNILWIIERRREIRHLLGHWAARRIPGEDAIVLVTKDETDAKRTGGSYLTLGKVKQAVLDLTDLRLIFEQQIAPIELWLAKKVSDWHKRYVGD